MDLQRLSCVCISRFLPAVPVAFELGHALPVAQDHGQRRQRRPQFVRGAGCQQAHAHDVLFLRRPLAQVRQLGRAAAHVLRDAGDEHHQQRRVEMKQISMPCTYRLKMPSAWSCGSGSGSENSASPAMHAGDDDDGPGRPRLQQHRAKDHCSRYRNTNGLVAPPLR
jgi:hypothetical protein